MTRLGVRRRLAGVTFAWLLAVSAPAGAAPAMDPLPAAATRLDAAESRLTTPYRIDAVRSAAGEIAEADRLLDQWLGGSDAPAACARIKGVSGFQVLAVFNRFNELSERVEELQSFRAEGPWATDAQTTAFRRERERQAQAARRSLPAAAAAAFLAFAKVGESMTGVASPWQRESGPRYGYDMGRFVRVETITFGPGRVRQRHGDLSPRPWRAGGTVH